MRSKERIQGVKTVPVTKKVIKTKKPKKLYCFILFISLPTSPGTGRQSVHDLLKLSQLSQFTDEKPFYT